MAEENNHLTREARPEVMTMKYVETTRGYLIPESQILRVWRGGPDSNPVIETEDGSYEAYRYIEVEDGQKDRAEKAAKLALVPKHTP